MKQQRDHYDVIIVGAGLSGISAAHHIKTRCPGKTFLILEARESMGGTWDLFRYPGIRSDSDMYTLGYSFRPWTNPKAIADGPAIRDYIKETAREEQLEQYIKYQHRVSSASWNSDDHQWTLICDLPTGSVEFSCGFLFTCSGYYRYDQGYMPDYPGVDDYEGQLIHPQHWPEDLDYSDQQITVIGSGATAVTLVPELAKQAQHVTMLQRTPTYVVSAPERDILANLSRKILPAKAAYRIARWKNILMSMAFYKAARRWPKAIKKMIQNGVKKELGKDYDIQKHFNPPYNPWDQRLCLVPDNDLFESLKSGKSEIVTDHIERFTSDGILLRSGKEIKSDIIVSATGLQMQVLGGMELTIDGQTRKSEDSYCYRGMMFSDIPNLANAMGYTNASWTLKCDLTAEHVCSLLNHMDRHNYVQVTPIYSDDPSVNEPLLDFSSGYVKRALAHLPKQGKEKPWRVHQNYIMDLIDMRYSKVADENLRFE